MESIVDNNRLLAGPALGMFEVFGEQGRKLWGAILDPKNSV